MQNFDSTLNHVRGLYYDMIDTEGMDKNYANAVVSSMLEIVSYIYDVSFSDLLDDAEYWHCRSRITYGGMDGAELPEDQYAAYDDEMFIDTFQIELDKLITN